MIFIHLLFEFFKIGTFSIGGGYATIPFLYQLITDYGWYTTKQLSNMIAISMLTPGPVGVNMATFAGFQTCGIKGGILATLALVMPSFLIVVFISKVLKKYHESFYLKAVMYALKPAGCGLLCSVMVSFFQSKITTIYAFVTLLFLFILSFKIKKNPLCYILITAFIGIILYRFKLI